MAIKDIFKMIKADRYTQDGREELIKAQEAITEDIRYKPGDISKATGLQKQPDGSWAPVKNAPAQSKKSDKTTPEEIAQIKELKTQYSKAKTDEERSAIANKVNEIMGVNERMSAEAKKETELRSEAASGDPQKRKALFDFQAQKASDEEIDMVLSAKERGVNHPADFIESYKEEKAKRSASGSAPGWRAPGSESDPNTEGSIAWYAQQAKKSPSASGSAPSAPKFETEQENAKYEEGLKGWDDVNPDRLPDIKKKVEQKIDYYKKYDPYAMLGKKTGLTAAQKSAVQQNMAQAKENLAFYTGQLEGINKKMGGGSKDSAPRILTGDCKIRIKKSK